VLHTGAQAAATAKAAAAGSSSSSISSSSDSQQQQQHRATHARMSRERLGAQRDSVQCSCKTKLRADGQAPEVNSSSDSGEESESVARRRKTGVKGEFVTKRKEPVPKWKVLAENKAAWEQLCKQLGLVVISFGFVCIGRLSGDVGGSQVQ
jgi:hypothetical protein